jgi:hypothetical protein
VLKTKRLKRGFLVFEISHSVLIVNASSVSAPDEILPEGEGSRTYPRFCSGRGSGPRGFCLMLAHLETIWTKLELR